MTWTDYAIAIAIACATWFGLLALAPDLLAILVVLTDGWTDDDEG